jgi:hypothetical protein
MSKRDTIAALLRKANCAGATKEEAFAAMQLALKLANKEGLSLKDIQENNDEANAFGKTSVRSGKDHLHPVDVLLAVHIGTFTCCKAWRGTQSDGHYVHFYGHDADVELAQYIRNMVIGALENGWLVRKMQVTLQGGAVHMKSERQSFVRGFCDEVKEKLLAYSMMRAPTTGTDLVVVKNALLVRKWDQYTKDNGMHLGPSHGRAKIHTSGAAYAAGRVAGANVVINDRAAGGAAVRAIGKQ